MGHRLGSNLPLGLWPPFWLKGIISLSALLFFSLGCRCEGNRGLADITAEERYGNDKELLSVFESLSRCAWRQESLDHSCPELRLLRERLASKRKSKKSGERIVKTLANLLESKKVRTRWAVAANLSPFMAGARTRVAVRQAYEKEKVLSIRVALLQELCRHSEAGRDAHLVSLLGKLIENERGAESERVEAIRCFARSPKPSRKTIDLLAKVVVEKNNAGLKSAACTGLGNHRIVRHAPALARGLSDPASQGPCANSLAKLATPEACAQLYGRLSKKSGSGAQLIASLGVFVDQRCWPKGALSRVLVPLAQKRGIERDRALEAASLLARLGVKAPPKTPPKTPPKDSH